MSPRDICDQRQQSVLSAESNPFCCHISAQYKDVLHNDLHRNYPWRAWVTTRRAVKQKRSCPTSRSGPRGGWQLTLVLF